MSPTHDVVVIGAGVGGICAGVRLEQAGIDDFVILDRADTLGGTWRDNVYPGVAVDIPSIAYQYSFARNPDWSRIFAPGAEVQAYHESVVDRFGLRPHFRFNTEVVGERWDDDAHLWRVELADGTQLSARFVISAVGAFLDPKPAMPGLDDYLGTTIVPARWLPEYDTRGQRVGLIGTGATGVQLAPALVDGVASLTVFQRTPVYCIPKPDLPIPRILQLIQRIPGVTAAVHSIGLIGAEIGLWGLLYLPGALMRPAMRAFDAVSIRAYRRYLRAIVDNPQTAAALAPDFGLFGNRPTLNSKFPRIFNRTGIDLVTTGIDRIVPEGVRTVDGVVHEFDCLITATGFDLFCEPTSYKRGRVVGIDGADLADYFDTHGMQAYDSVAVHGFPNRWIIVGPYSWTGTGWHGLVENATKHIVRAIRLAREREATKINVSAAAQDAFHATMLRRGRNLKYYFTELNSGVRSYWKNADGDIPVLRAATFLQAHRSAAHFNPDDYEYSCATAVSIARLAATDVQASGAHA